MEIVAIIISLASLIVSIRAIRVSKDIAKMQLEYEENAEKRRDEKEKLAEEKRENEKHQEQRDWQEAERRVRNSRFPIIEGTMKDRIEEEFRKIRSERILRGKN